MYEATEHRLSLSKVKSLIMRSSKLVYYSFIVVVLLCFAQCKKERFTNNMHSVDLTKKSLDEIRTTISGNWVVARNTICGFVGCSAVYNDISTADIMSFLPDDTLKHTAHAGTPVYRYEKADSIKFKSSYYDNQPAWTFYFSTPLTFIRIQNDTLVAETNLGEIGLLRKP